MLRMSWAGLQVAAAPMLRTAKAMGVMDKVESVAAMIPGMREAQASLSAGLQQLPTSPAELKQVALVQAQQLRAASRALDPPLGIKPFAEQATLLGRAAQTRMAAASPASPAELLAHAEMTAEHAWVVLRRLLVTAAVGSVAQLRERILLLQEHAAAAPEELDAGGSEVRPPGRGAELTGAIL
jgi:hypothetical protein